VALSEAALEALVEGRREEAARFVGAELPEGWPDEHDARFLRLRLDGLRADPALGPWRPRAVVVDGTVVGHAGYHGPPGVNALDAADAVEIGYTIFAPYRRRGLASRAAEEAMQWARREHGIRRFVASVAPDNEASLGVVRRLGFVQQGERWDDEDGLELVFELTVP
jgi:RimJ/RimL family protein N-acetyltransferase